MNIYDEEIIFLTRNPDKIHGYWREDANKDQALFRSLKYFTSEGYIAHCPVEIKSGEYDGCINVSFIPALKSFVEEIKKDPRIPQCSSEITVESLPAFKEYQEKWDEILKGLETVS